MWRYLFLVPVYLLATSLPLLTMVGANLEYEYALLSSYLALAFVPAVALALPDRFLPRDEDGIYAPPAALEMFWIFLISPLFGLAAGGFLFLTGRCLCSAPGFGFWMAVVWYPAWILAHAVFHAVLRARCATVAPMPRWQILATLVLCYAAVLALAGADLWLAPQKRLINLVAGYLHGPIYDEWIAVDSGLLLARASHVGLATMLLLLAWSRRRAVPIAAVLLAGAAWIFTGYLATDYPSVGTGKQALDGLMPGTLAGDGFTLHYLPGTDAKRVPVSVQRLFRDTQFHVLELTKILAGDGTPLPHVEVYIYPDEDRKKLWFGGGSTDVTDVHTPSIHIAGNSWPHPTLRHELVHALASGFGYHGLGFHPNMAFTEGLAVALAPSPGTLTLDDGAASLLQTGRLPRIDELFSPAFWRFAGGRAYTVAGSFLRHLIAKHGIAGVKALYAGRSWDEAFGQSRDSLIKEWEEAISATESKERIALYAEALYRYPGLFGDLCPHSKADLRRNRDGSFYTRMRQPVGWDPDADYLSWLIRLDPDDKDTRLKLWQRELKRLANDRFPPQGRLATWREVLGRARVKPPKALEDVSMGIVESDVARLLGDVDGSLRILTELAEENKKHFFGDSIEREITARIGVEAAPGGQAGEWRRYLAGWRRNAPAADLHAGPWLLSYLKLRNERDSLTVPAELVRLLTETQPDPLLPATFHHEWYRLIGDRLMVLGAFKDASAAFTKAAAVANAATREVFEEHARRAAYFAQLGPLAPAPEDGKPTH